MKASKQKQTIEVSNKTRISAGKLLEFMWVRKQAAKCNSGKLLEWLQVRKQETSSKIRCRKIARLPTSMEARSKQQMQQSKK